VDIADDVVAAEGSIWQLSHYDDVDEVFMIRSFIFFMTCAPYFSTTVDAIKNSRLLDHGSFICFYSDINF